MDDFLTAIHLLQCFTPVLIERAENPSFIYYLPRLFDRADQVEILTFVP